jgi:hypothetical protein
VLPPIPGVDPADPVLTVTDAQIRWYDTNSQRSRLWHFRLRTAQLLFAAIIPITQVPLGAVGWRLAAAALGGLVALCQGIDTIHHYGDHYVAWRATCQRMLRERQLFAARAGPYADGKDPKLLASNLALIEDEEQQQWRQGQLAEGVARAAK